MAQAYRRFKLKAEEILANGQTKEVGLIVEIDVGQIYRDSPYFISIEEEVECQVQEAR